MRAVPPGEILKQEVEELGIAPAEFASLIDEPVNYISEIIAGDRSVTGDTALRFGHWFGTAPQFWMNLQAEYDLRSAIAEVGNKIAKLPVCHKSASLGASWEGRVSRAVLGFARNCTSLYMENPYAEPLLEKVMNELMTEFWDRGFSQTEIKAAFPSAVADMPRYAVGEERSGRGETFQGSNY